MGAARQQAAAGVILLAFAIFFLHSFVKMKSLHIEKGSVPPVGRVRIVQVVLPESEEKRHTTVKPETVILERPDAYKNTDSPVDLTKKLTIIPVPDYRLYIYTAIMDDRFWESVVRINGLLHKDQDMGDLTCQYMDSSGTKKQVPAKYYFVDPTWPNWGHYFAIDIECHLVKGTAPKAIEIITNKGKTLFKVDIEYVHKFQHRGTLAVCLKPTTGHIPVARLVEWFEMLRLVGVEDVMFYNTDLIGTSHFVPEYYERLGIARIVPFPYLSAILQHLDSNGGLTGSERYAVYQQTYMVAMQDCLLRFSGRYENLMFIDLDEIMIPTQNRTLTDLVREMRKNYISGAGFLFYTSWHFLEKQEPATGPISNNMYMHTLPMATVPLNVQGKSIVSTDRALSVNFHSILDVPLKEYSNEVMPWKTTAYVHHFRGKCSDKFETWRCTNFLNQYHRDPVMPRYQRELKHRITTVMDILGVQ